MNAQVEFLEIDAPLQKIMFVDDEPNILASLKRLLRSEGYYILTANSAEEGLELLEKEGDIDLVVSDMRMPGMDGAEFLKIVHEKWPDTLRILLTGYSDIASTISAINEGNIYQYIAKPWEDNDLKLTLKRAIEQKGLVKQKLYLENKVHNQNAELKELNENLEDKVKSRTEEIRQTSLFLESAHKELKQSYKNSIEVFANLLELRADRIAGHSRRVAEYAKAMAEMCKRSNEEVRAIYFASLLHDIGKIGLSDALINKPYSKMNPAEKQEYEKHPVMGQAVLMAIDELHDAAQIIRSHHERFDGNGYPDKLKGADIPLGARIIHVVSDYDELLHGTINGNAMESDEAQQYLLKHQQTYYDPQVVDLFIKFLKVYKDRGQDGVLLVTVDELKPGMVIAKDLATPDGILLLTKGHIITQPLIDRLIEWGDKAGSGYVYHVKKVVTAKPKPRPRA